MSLAVDAGPMTVSEGSADVCHKKGDCEAGASEGSSVSDDGGGGDGDLGRFDLKGPLIFGGISA